MNVVNPNNTTHNLKIIPRANNIGILIFELFNEETKQVFLPTFTALFEDGYLTLTFDFNFVENQKFQIKIYNDIIYYRGKLMATSQNTQTFKASKDLYYYE